MFGDEWGRWGIELCRKGIRGEAHECFEWGAFYCGVGVGVMSKLCKWEKGDPVRLSHIAESSEELLQLLVKMFCLTISLQVVHSAEVLVDIQEAAEGTSEMGCK